MQKKVLYNLIKLNLNRLQSAESDLSYDLEPWQIEDYREKDRDLLFQKLSSLVPIFTLEEFETHASSFNTPEEMAGFLAKEHLPLEQDQAYLVIFELWRRLFPERRSLSIFCDELDYQIGLHDAQKIKNIEEIQDLIAYLKEILEENADQEIKPKTAFQLIQRHLANDIEGFLFDYILEQIEAGNHSYALELIEDFYKFVQGEEWFDYLKARALILKDPEEGYDLLEEVIKNFNSHTHLALVEEALFYLANSGNHSLFHQLANKAIPLLEVEADFCEFLEICYTHYDYLELKEPALKIAQIFYDRTNLSPDSPFSKTDSDFLSLKQILDQKLSFANE